MYKEIISEIRPHLDKTVDFFAKEVGKVKVGQASPALVEDVVVEFFGQKLPLKQMASLSCPEPRQIVIRPWEKSYLEAIANALSSSVLGASSIVDKDVVRVVLSPLTQESRQELIKNVSEKTEEAKNTLRKWRDVSWTRIQEETRAGKIREDDKFKAKDELQKLIDDYIHKAEEFKQKKVKEIEA